jgi:CubicO group peptidase (beta-lactamase class C family)
MGHRVLLTLLKLPNFSSSLFQVMRETILNPLGLTHTFYDGGENRVGDRARGYQTAFGTLSDSLTEVDRSAVGGSGALLSTSEDITRFSQALFSGSLISLKSLKELLDFVPVTSDFGWGLGVERSGTPWGDYWGRGGNDGSFTTQVAYLPNRGTTATVQFNRDYSLENSPQTAPNALNSILAEFRAILGEPSQST